MRRKAAPHGTALLVVSGPETLAPSLKALAASGTRVERWTLLRPVPRRDPPKLPRPRPSARRNILLVTSPQTADLYLRRFPEELTAWVRTGEVWAVGPTTAARLRGLGVRTIKLTPSLGTAALPASLGPLRSSLVVYPRSRRAGPALARALRRKGARVREVVAYEVEVGRRVPRRELSYLLKARAVLATSPSALDALRAAVGRPTFERLRRDLPLLVLGPRSLSRGRELGFRRVRAITPPFEKAINALLAQPKADAS